MQNANEVRRGFPDSEHLVIGGATHTDLYASHPDIQQVVEDFLADRPLSLTRINLPPLRFDS